MKKELYREEKIEDVENKIDENEDIIHMYEPLKMDMDKNYQYIKTGKIFSFFSNVLYYGIAYPVLLVLDKIIYDLKIEGKENIKSLKKGAVSVSNHVLILDCTMVGLALKSKKVYFTTRKGSFEIPFVRKLIKLLRAIPIPENIKSKKEFISQLDNAISNGKVIHFYPEKSLWPYYDKLRNFKNGAFDFAIRNNVPVIPIVITFRDPKGIRKVLKKKKDVTVKILSPISYEENIDNKKECIEKLKQKVHSEMEENLKNINI